MLVAYLYNFHQAHKADLSDSGATHQFLCGDTSNHNCPSQTIVDPCISPAVFSPFADGRMDGVEWSMWRWLSRLKCQSVLLVKISQNESTFKVWAEGSNERLVTNKKKLSLVTFIDPNSIMFEINLPSLYINFIAGVTLVLLWSKFCKLEKAYKLLILSIK